MDIFPSGIDELNKTTQFFFMAASRFLVLLTIVFSSCGGPKTTDYFTQGFDSEGIKKMIELHIGVPLPSGSTVELAISRGVRDHRYWFGLIVEKEDLVNFKAKGFSDRAVTKYNFGNIPDAATRWMSERNFKPDLVFSRSNSSSEKHLFLDRQSGLLFITVYGF